MSIIQNEYGVAGLMGNLQAESGLIPYRLQGDFTSDYIKSIEYTNKVNSGDISYSVFSSDGKGYGLAQWTSSNRKRNLYNYTPLSNVGIGDLNRQIPFLIYELQTSYPSVYSTLVNATSIRQASNKVLHDYENPAEQGTSVENYRESLGVSIYNAQHGYTPPTPPTPPPTPPTPTPGGLPPLWLLRVILKNRLS